MSALDEAIGSLTAVQKSVATSSGFVARADDMCGQQIAALQGGGFGRAGQILTAVSTSLRNDVLAGLNLAESNTSSTLEALTAADQNDLDQAEVALKTGQTRLEELRGQTANLSTKITQVTALVAQIGSRSQKIIALLEQANQELGKVITHEAAATTATDKAAQSMNSNLS